MEMNQHCLDTLRKLAQGIDPRSGLPLPEEDACQAPEVIRALFQAIQALEAQGKVRPPPELRRGSGPSGHGAGRTPQWTRRTGKRPRGGADVRPA